MAKHYKMYVIPGIVLYTLPDGNFLSSGVALSGHDNSTGIVLHPLSDGKFLSSGAELCGRFMVRECFICR